MPKKHIIGLLVGSLFSATALSATVYVSDIQFVAIREGLDNSTRAIERGIKSGTPLEVIKQDNGYTKVRTPNGNEGWVADYFLSEDVVIREQINILQTSIESEAKKRANLSTSLEANEKNLQKLNALNTSLQEENNILNQQIERDAKSLEKAQEIIAQSEGINYQIESLKQQTNTANMQAEKLRDTTTQRWFMIGAATLFGGMLLGTLMPMIRRKKKNSGSWS